MISTENEERPGAILKWNDIVVIKDDYNRV